MADEITQADRELLAAECPLLALADKENLSYVPVDAALRAIAAARRQGQVSDGWPALMANMAAYIRAEGGENGRILVESADAMLAAPPSAPVGVEAMPGLRRSLAKIVRLDEGEPVWIEPNEAEAILAALVQQPAPVAPVGVEDKARAMFEAQADDLAAPWIRQWEPTKDFWRKRAAEALAQQPAPVAPVGVDARKRSAAELQKFIDLADDYDLDDCAIGALEAGIAALAQQPAAVDEAMVLDASRWQTFLRVSSGGSIQFNDGTWMNADEPVSEWNARMDAMLAAAQQEGAP